MHRSFRTVLFLVVLCGILCLTGCGNNTDRERFQMDVIDTLPHTWKYYATDAVETLLYNESERYQHSSRDIIEKQFPDLLERYQSVASTVESYRCSSESYGQNQLVKKISELRKIQAQRSKEDEKRAAQLLKGLTNSRLGITPEMEKKHQAIKEEKYEMSLQLLERDMYDDFWFALREFGGRDDSLSLSKVGILYVYFKRLPKLEVYFYKDPDNHKWVAFYSMTLLSKID